jgi:hypothetical protein
MDSLYQLALGESVPFRVTPSHILPGDTVTVRSSHLPAATVQMDASPIGDGAIASGHINGGKFPASAVAIQATIMHADNTTSTAVFMIDVGGGTPPPPKPAPPPEAIRVHIELGQSMASKAAAKKAEVEKKA